MWPSNGSVSSLNTPLYALPENVKTMISMTTKIAGCATYMAYPLKSGRRMIAISRSELYAAAPMSQPLAKYVRATCEPWNARTGFCEIQMVSWWIKNRTRMAVNKAMMTNPILPPIWKLSWTICRSTWT